MQFFISRHFILNILFRCNNQIPQKNPKRLCHEEELKKFEEPNDYLEA